MARGDSPSQRRGWGERRVRIRRRRPLRRFSFNGAARSSTPYGGSTGAPPSLISTTHYEDSPSPARPARTKLELAGRNVPNRPSAGE